MIAELTDEQHGLVLASAAALIAGVSGTEMPAKAPAAAKEPQTDPLTRTIRLRDGKSRRLTPTLWALFVALSDGNWHRHADLRPMLRMQRPSENALRVLC